MTTPFLPPRTGVRVFAHRGLALEAPENTIAAFRAAIDAGTDYIETDVHATADGRCVIHHDPELVAGGRRYRIRESPFAALAELDLGGGERLPLLEDALAAFPGVRFNVDVKAPDAAEPAAAAVRNAAAAHRVLLTSFDERTRGRAVSAAPGVATSASSRLIVAALPWLYLGAPAAVRLALRGVDAVQLPERRGPLPLVTRRTVRVFHAAGVEVHVWTVNDEHEMRRLGALDVDGIVTDRCDIAASVFSV